MGILYKRNGVELIPIIHGGGQESGLRGGTYNTPLIVGMGKACELALKEFEENTINLKEKRKELEEYFENSNVGTVNFKCVERAPHILSITIKNEDAEEYLIKNRSKIAASTGSACNSEIIQESHVIKSIKNLKNVVRISLGTNSF
jgi:cysteine desulfurase